MCRKAEWHFHLVDFLSSKEKERELDAKNIYANRMMKSSIKNETDGSTKRKGNFWPLVLIPELLVGFKAISKSSLEKLFCNEVFCQWYSFYYMASVHFHKGYQVKKITMWLKGKLTVFIEEVSQKNELM